MTFRKKLSWNIAPDDNTSLDQDGLLTSIKSPGDMDQIFNLLKASPEVVAV